MTKRSFAFLAACALWLAGARAARPAPAAAPQPPVSTETRMCLMCHERYTPGLVADWRASRHSQVTPAEGLKKPEAERRVSATDIPKPLQAVTVGCYECHSRNLERHKDAFDHNGFRIAVVVSPNDCRTCHATEVDQYAGSKKAHALANLQKNPVYDMLVETLTGVTEVNGDRLEQRKASEHAKGDSCYACHGTTVTVRGMKKVKTAMGEIEVPDLANWPNQGTGRVNPDGSAGACTSCHPRHAFSIEVARKPHTCAQCHLEPDVPAWEVYRESKHGNIYLSNGSEWNWDRVPWVGGRDFRTPTCATCHSSGLAVPDGTVVAPRTHDFGARLWTRLFGLPYTHPQPKSGETHLIRNADGQPLPTTFLGQPAASFLIDAAEQQARRSAMRQVCTSCHSTSWADGHFAKLDTAIAETDRMTLSVTRVMQAAWDRKLADPANPFDEPLEYKWISQWLFYANSTRYASAMGGPDLAAFKNGWWAMNRNLREIHHEVYRKP